MKIVNKTQAELGISTQDALLLLMQIASDKIDTIVPTSSSLNVDDIDGFGLTILRKSVKMLNTLVLINMLKVYNRIHLASYKDTNHSNNIKMLVK